MMAVALVGAGEAMATRVSTGDIDVDEATKLMIGFFWHGLKGTPEQREHAAEAGDPSVARRLVRLAAISISSARWSSSDCWPGIAGVSTTFVLRFVQHLTYHYTFGTLARRDHRRSPVRRVLGPMVGGALAGARLVGSAAPSPGAAAGGDHRPP